VSLFFVGIVGSEAKNYYCLSWYIKLKGELISGFISNLLWSKKKALRHTGSLGRELPM
jgi:hypothetical protein